MKAVFWLPPAAYHSCSWPIHAIRVEPCEANRLPSTLASAAWSHGRGPEKCVSAWQRQSRAQSSQTNACRSKSSPHVCCGRRPAQTSAHPRDVCRNPFPASPCPARPTASHPARPRPPPAQRWRRPAAAAPSAAPRGPAAPSAAAASASPASACHQRSIMGQAVSLQRFGASRAVCGRSPAHYQRALQVPTNTWSMAGGVAPLHCR